MIAVAWMIALSDAGVAWAEGAPTALRIAYRASEGCPTEPAYTSQVLARTARVRLAASDEETFVSLRVTVAPGSGGFSGRLEVFQRGGDVLERAVEGDSCEEVVSALALVTALTFDPKASSAPSSGQLPPVPEAAPEPEASAPPPEPSRPPEPRPPPSEPRDPWVGNARSDRSDRSGWRVGLGADVALRGGVTPDPIVTLPVFVELGLPRAEPFALSFRASFERSATDHTDVAPGTAAFRWTAGALEACPVVGTQGDFSVRPCLRVEGGVLEAEGSGILPARQQRRGWAAVGAAVGAEWLFLEPAFAEIGAGGVVPLTRDRFFFQPDRTVHRPAAVGWLVRAGMGLRFP